jgi:hypothetical protein
MAAPSKSFTVIADSAIDADSPITADLMEDYRDNDIYLQEWLGKNYTAAVDHDHDGVNSKTINIAGSLSFYEEQTTFDPTGASWSVSTGSLGFEPALVHIRWGFATTTAVGSSHFHGWGWAWGTGSGEQFGISLKAEDDSADSFFGIVGYAYDSDNIMGFDNGIVQSNFRTWSTSFATEQADVTGFSSGGITIDTVSGQWSASAPTNCTIVFFVWGS